MARSEENVDFLATYAASQSADGFIVAAGGLSGTATRRLKRLTHLPDPPRLDFDRPAIARRRSFYEGALGTTAEERLIGPLLDGLGDSTALLGAFVRSLEKVQGALEAERQDFARRRLQDAQEFAARLPPSLTRVARDARTFAAHLEASEAMPRTEADRLGGRWAPGVKTLDAYFGDRPCDPLSVRHSNFGHPTSATRVAPLHAIPRGSLCTGYRCTPQGQSSSRRLGGIDRAVGALCGRLGAFRAVDAFHAPSSRVGFRGLIQVP